MRPFSPLDTEWSTPRSGVTLIETVAAVVILGLMASIGVFYVRDNKMTGAAEAVALSDLVRLRTESGLRQTGSWERSGGLTFSAGVTPVAVSESNDRLVAVVRPSRGTRVCGVVVTPTSSMTPRCGVPEPVPAASFSVSSQDVTTPDGPRVAWTLRATPALTGSWPVVVPTGALAPVGASGHSAGSAETSGNTGAETSGTTGGASSEATIAWTLPTGETVTLGSTDSTLLSTGITRFLTPTQAANASEAGLMVVSGSGRVRADGGGPTTVVVGTFTNLPAGTTVAAMTPIVFDATGLSVAGTAPTVWQWAFGDGTYSSLRQPTKMFMAAGTHTVTLRLMTATGILADVQTRTMTVTAPVAPIGNLAPVAVLSSNLVWVPTGTPVILRATGSHDPNAATGDAIVSYAYNNGAGSAMNTTLTSWTSATYRSAGTFTATLTVRDRSGLTHTASRVITVSPLAAPLSLPFSLATTNTASFIPGDSALVTIAARNVNNLLLTGAMPTAALASSSANLTVSTASGAVSGAQASRTFVVRGTLPGVYTVTPSLNGQAMPPLTITIISSGVASAVSITTAPDSATSRQAMSAPVTVQLRDAFGNPVALAGRSVTLAIGTWAPLSSPAGTLSGTTTATTNASGMATFTGAILTGNSATVSLSVTAQGVATQTPISIVVRNTAPTSGSVSCATSGPTLAGLLCSATAGSDAEGDAVSVEFETLGGTATGTGLSRTITRSTPGTIAVRLRTVDLFGNASDWTTATTLTLLNQAPTAPVISCSPLSTPTGSASTCSIQSPSTDVDGGVIAYTWSATGRTGSATGTSTTYQLNTPGTASATATATDGQGGTSAASNGVTMTFTNQTPTTPVISCSPLSTPTGSASTCSIATSSTDADGGVIAYTWSAANRTGAATGNSTTYSLATPGIAVATATAADGQGGTSAVSNSVTLTFTNQIPTAPVISCSPLSTPTGTASTCSIATPSTDADGGVIVYTWSSANRTGAATGTSTTYSLATPGTSAATATATDGQGGASAVSNSVTMTFTNQLPTAPVISCSPLSTPTGSSSTCSIQTPSTDADGGVIAYTWSSTGRTGSATGTSTTYSLTTPGSATASVTAADGQGGTSAASNGVSLTFTNRAPTLGTLACTPLSASSGVPVTCAASGFSDPDGGIVSYEYEAFDSGWASVGTRAETTVASATFTFTLPGSYVVQTRVRDNQGSAFSAWIPASAVSAINQSPTAPVISCTPLTLATGSSSTCSIQTPSTDADGGVISYTWSATGRTGSATGNSTTYQLSTPGSASVTATAADGQGGTSPASTAVSLTFTNRAPTAPVISCAPLSTPTGTASTCSIATPSTDPEGGTISYTWSATNRTGAATGNSTTYSLATPGTSAATATAADGQGGTSPASNSVTMTFTNQLPTTPVISCSPLNTPTGSASTCSIATASTDADGGVIGYTWSSANRTGAATGNSTTYSLATPGTSAATATAADGQGGTSGTSNSVTMTFTNQLPTTPVISCAPLTTPTGSASTCSIATPSTDADGGAIAYTWSAANRTGAATGTSTTYSLATPGTAAATATAADGQGGTSAVSNSVAMTFTNRAPTAPVISCSHTSRFTGETSTCSISAGSTDPDGGTVAYTWSSTGRTGSATGTSTTYSLTTPGSVTASATAADGQGGTSAASTGISITFLNQAPTAPGITCAPLSTPTGSASTCSIQTASTDTDGGTIAYTWSSANRTGAATGSSTTYSLATPGTAAATATASDGQGGTSGTSNSVTMTFTNRAPTAAAISCTPTSTPSGSSSTCSIQTASTDPDGGSITYTWSGTGRTGPAAGTSTTYSLSTPGGLTATTTASDGQGGVSAASNGVGLTFTNRAPTNSSTSCSPMTLPTGNTITCTMNWTDPDGGTLQYFSGFWNSAGMVAFVSPLWRNENTLSFTPTTPGSYAFYHGARDNQGFDCSDGGRGGDHTCWSNPIIFTVTNRPPTAPGISCSHTSRPTGSAITCSIAAASTDPDGGTIAYTWSATGRTGAATGNSTTYQLNTPGGLTATATATDGQGGSSAASAGIGLTFTNRDPVHSGTSCSPMSLSTGTTITCTMNWADPDGGTLSYLSGFWVTTPAWNMIFSADWRSGNTLSFTPTLPGTYAFLSVVRDGQGFDQESGGSNNWGNNAVYFTVANRAPTAPSISCSPTSVLTAQSIVCTASGGTDPDGGTVTYDWSIDGSVIFSGTGNSIATITNALPKTISAFVRARDGQGTAYVSEGFSGYVNQGGLTWANRRPAVPTMSISQSTVETNQVFSLTVATAGDPEGHSVDMHANIIDIGWNYINGQASGFIGAGGGPQSFTSSYAINLPGTYYAIPYVRDVFDQIFVSGSWVTFTVVAPAPATPSAPTNASMYCFGNGETLTCNASATLGANSSYLTYTYSSIGPILATVGPTQADTASWGGLLGFYNVRVDITSCNQSGVCSGAVQAYGEAEVIGGNQT